MATRTWQNVADNAFTNDNSHWGTALVSTDSALMPVNTYDRTSGLTALGAVDLVDMEIGQGVLGTLGDATGITFGACTGKLVINAPLSTAIYIKPTSWAKIIVRGCSQNTNGVMLVDGTITDFTVETDGRVRLGAAGNITTLYVSNGNVYIEPGCAITTIYQSGGVIEDYAGGWTTCYANGGTYKALGDTTLTLGTFHIGGGHQVIKAPATITAVRGNGPGFFDMTQDPRAKTIANGHALKGFTLDARGAVVTASNNLLQKGGQIYGITPSSITLDTLEP